MRYFNGHQWNHIKAVREPPSTGGDRAKVMSLLDEALAISRELVMRPFMDRVLSCWKFLRA